MTQVQFFIFGMLLIWFTASGKLNALIAALRTNPAEFDPTIPDTPLPTDQATTSTDFETPVGPLGPITEPGNPSTAIA